MRFLFGLGLGLLVPMAVRAIAKAERPVVLEAIQGGLSEAGIEEEPRAEPEAAAGTASGQASPEKDASPKPGTSEKPEDQGSQG